MDVGFRQLAYISTIHVFVNHAHRFLDWMRFRRGQTGRNPTPSEIVGLWRYRVTTGKCSLRFAQQINKHRNSKEMGGSTNGAVNKNTSSGCWPDSRLTILSPLPTILFHIPSPILPNLGTHFLNSYVYTTCLTFLVMMYFLDIHQHEK
jgi:hypothetical protein